MADQAAQRASEKFDEIDKKFQDFLSAVNNTLNWVPEPFVHLIEPIQRSTVDAEKRKSEFRQRLARWFQQPGDAESLRSKGESWATQVGDPLGAIAGKMSMINLRTYTEWTGPAAEAYKAIVPAQGAALGDLKGLAQQVRTSMDNLANALDSFYLSVEVALAVAVVGITGAIVGAATIVGALPAIAALLTTLGVVIGLITTIITSMNSFLDTIEIQQTALRQKIHDVGSTWPKSSHDIGDGGVTDGDRSEWRYNG